MSLILDGTSGITTNAGTLISASTIGVGGATPASSGAGISFPATQSASTDANTLDDYEEGTFTPYIDTSTSGTGRATNVYNAKYTKVGNLCTFQFYISLGTLGSGGSGQWVVKGLPFTPFSNASNSLQAVSIGYVDTLKANLVCITGFVSDNNPQVQIEGMAAAATITSALTFSTYVQVGTTLIVGGSYIVA